MNRLPRLHRISRRPSFERLEERIALTAESLFIDPSGLSPNRIGFIPPEPAELVSQDRALYEVLTAARLVATPRSFATPALVPVADTFFLHSRPTATKTIYIDFDGNTTRGTSWNTASNIDSIVSPAYDPDGNGAPFSSNELLRIQRIWQRVAEDFAPFHVNVTTQDPGQAALVKSGGSDNEWGIRVVVTTNNFYSSNAGGVAYIDSFNWNLESSGATDTPVWVFNSSEIGVSAAISHEVGHSLGLLHDGTTASNPIQPGSAYYDGHGSGETSWGPIMGSGYYQNVTTWDQGEYFGASNSGSKANDRRGASDIAIISAYNGFRIRTDDHGNSRSTATTVGYEAVDPSTNLVGVSLFGVIEDRSDIDFARFETGGGIVNLTIDPYVSEIWRSDGNGEYARSVESAYFNVSNWPNNQGSNLDVEAKLYDDAGLLIATSNPAGLRATFANQLLSVGTYYVSVEGVGFGNPASSSAPTGYTDYGSLGQYLISGTVVSPGLTVRAVAVDADKPEGNRGRTEFEFAVTLSELQATAISVDWMAVGSGSSPADAADFGGSLPSGTITIPAGQFSATAVVSVSGDDEFEPDETFMLALANPTLGTVIVGDVGIIRNDDRAAILLVDDDQNADLEVYFQTALSANGYQFETWEVSTAQLPDASILNLYDAVIWNTGYDFLEEDAGLTELEQQALMSYLDAGGRLFLSGQDILYNGVASDFQRDYLKVASFTNDALTSSHIENGVGGNPIGDGLTLSISAPTGFGMLYVDALTPTAEGTGVFLLPSTDPNPYTAVSFRGNYSEGGFGVVFLSVPFESISDTATDPNNQTTVMQRIVDFLLPPPAANMPPVVTLDSLAVSGAEGVPITNTGRWSDVDLPADAVVLTATSGSIVKYADGTWQWELTTGNEVEATEVVVTADDGAGGVSSATFTYFATNVAPALSVESEAVFGNVLSEITNQGIWSDVPADNVAFAASIGSITSLPDGTWSWSLTASSKMDDVEVLIFATDGVDSTVLAFDVSADVNVSNSQVYYNRSAYSAGGTNVAAALDPDKVLAFASAQPQTLSYDNLINTTRGINGIVLDVAGLAGTTLTTADFIFRMSPQSLFDEGLNPPRSWQEAPAPTGIFVTVGNATTPTRVRLEWPDNAIENRWLQLQLLANTNTGLTRTAVCYLGHLKGELNGQLIAGSYFVSNADLSSVMPLGGGLMSVDNIRDVDKNRFVSNSDGIAIRSAVVAGLKLRNITIPISGSIAEGVGRVVTATPLARETWSPPPIILTKPPVPSMFLRWSTDERTRAARIRSRSFFPTEKRSAVASPTHIPLPHSTAETARAHLFEKFDELLPDTISTFSPLLWPTNAFHELL